MRLSVVIPAYNAAETIAVCLDALAAQERAPDELLVVDSSSDATPEIVRSRGPGCLLQHLPRRTLPGRARNLGLARATGDLVVFTDADCVPRRDWLRNLERAAATRPDTAGFGGAVENANPANPVSRTGFLVDEGDVKGMAARMIELVQSPSLASELGQRGREHIVANYSLEERIATLAEVIQWAVAR